MEITYNDKKYTINKYYSESITHFKLRIEFIKKMENKEDFKEALRLSKVWMNIKFKEARYVAPLYHKIKKYDKSI